MSYLFAAGILVASPMMVMADAVEEDDVIKTKTTRSTSAASAASRTSAENTASHTSARHSWISHQLYIAGNVGGALGMFDTVAAATQPDSSQQYGMHHNHQSGITVSVHLGWEMTDYLSFETGAFLLPSMDTLYTSYKGGVSIVEEPGYKLSFYGADVVAKGKFPILNNKVHIFTALGLAYVHEKGEDLQHGRTRSHNNTDTESKTYTVAKFRPEVELGIEYDVTLHIAVTASYKMILGTGKIGQVHGNPGKQTITHSRKAIPNMHLFTVGLFYRFNV